MEMNDVNVQNLKFEDIQLIKAAGSAMLGVVLDKEKRSVQVLGVNCSSMPEKADFTELFKAIVTGKADGLTIDNPQNITTMNMKATQKLAFAGAHAEFLVALEMQEATLTEMVLDKLL